MTTTDTRTGHSSGDGHTSPAGAGPHLPDDQDQSDHHLAAVVGDPNSTIGRGSHDSHTSFAGGGHNFRNGHSPPENPGQSAIADQTLGSQDARDTLVASAAGSYSPPTRTQVVATASPSAGPQDMLNAQVVRDHQTTTAVEQPTPEPATDDPTAKNAALVRDLAADDRSVSEAHVTCVVGPTSQSTIRPANANDVASAGDQTGDGHASRGSQGCVAVSPPAPVSDSSVPIFCTPVLADPLLALSADVLDDLERVRIANENRLRQLTRDESDSDGEERGFGLTLDHPDVARLAALVDALKKAEHDAELNLKRQLRKHPLGPWVKQARGVGEKQAARLLAAVGDPYWNDLHDRPRLVSELWSYCGYGDAKAQVRKRGEKSRWSPTAKMRTYLVSVSIVKAGGPYREVYDRAREKYDGALHVDECKRCGPSGKPALPGSPLSAGHQHARAVRAISKQLLKDLWIEARRIHEESQ